MDIDQVSSDLSKLSIDQVNPIFQISEKVRTNGPIPPKYEIVDKNIFSSKNIDNFYEFSENFTFLRFWCSHNKRKNLQKESPSWRIGLKHYLYLRTFNMFSFKESSLLSTFLDFLQVWSVNYTSQFGPS